MTRGKQIGEILPNKSKTYWLCRYKQEGHKNISIFWSIQVISILLWFYQKCYRLNTIHCFLWNEQLRGYLEVKDTHPTNAPGFIHIVGGFSVSNYIEQSYLCVTFGSCFCLLLDFLAWSSYLDHVSNLCWCLGCSLFVYKYCL